MSKMRSYGTARGLFSLLSFVAWSMIFIGVFVAVMAAGNTSQYAPKMLTIAIAIFGVTFAVFGLFLLAIIQNSRATVDNAEYTQQMLKIARDQLAVSREALKGGTAPEVSFETKPDLDSSTKTAGYTPPENKQIAEVHENDPEVEKGDKDGFLEYSGKMIEVKGGTYFLDGAIFTSLEKARAKIEKRV